MLIHATFTTAAYQPLINILTCYFCVDLATVLLTWLVYNIDFVDHHLRVLSHKEHALAVWPFPLFLISSAQRITASDSLCPFFLVPKVGNNSFVFLTRVAKHKTAERSVCSVYEETKFYPEVNACSFSRNHALAKYCICSMCILGTGAAMTMIPVSF